MKLSKKDNKYDHAIGLLVLSLSIITIISAILLSIPITHAETISSDASISVGLSCSMIVTPGTGGTASSDGYTYEANVTPGNYTEVDGSILTTTCNGPGNYSLYTIGYSGDSYDTPTNTQMISSTGSNNIVTGTATSGSTSNWAFKLASVAGASTPTIISPYSSYSNIPGDNFAKVATMLGTTGLASTSKVQAKYQIYASSTQTAGTYTGKVKYTFVYPNDAPAPTPPPAPPTSCNTPVPNVTYMQDITPSIKASVLASLTEDAPYYIRDNRDEEPYCVSKLKDGNLWMLDNLRLDITDSTTLNSLTTSNTHVDSASLTSLKSGNRSAGNQYASSGFVKWDSSSPDNIYNQAKANADYKDTTATSYGAGSGKIGVYYNYCAASAGSYCYDENAGTGNASYDLCPAGWRMPTGGSSGEYEALYTAYSSDANSFLYALSTPLSGYFMNGSATGQGSLGRFWSSTYTNGNKMYSLSLYVRNVSPTASSGRVFGYSLRCMLRS